MGMRIGLHWPCTIHSKDAVPGYRRERLSTAYSLKASGKLGLVDVVRR